MPGLVGFTASDRNIENHQETLAQMQDFITHQAFQIKDVLFNDGQLSSTRTHIGTIQKLEQPLQNKGYSIWMDGEFYNRRDILNLHPISGENDLELLCSLYIENSNFSFLKEIDGVYSAVFYDQELKKLYLINDRYGFRHLYWSIIDNELVWSSELKAFLKYPEFKAVIDPQSVEDFMVSGYLKNERTWFKSVQLLKPGSILCFDMQNKSCDVKSYWDWDSIVPLEEGINSAEIIEELDRLFDLAVKKRHSKELRMGIELSGGLDSRAILAAFPNHNPLHTVTFGQKNSFEKIIANKSARIKGSIHHDFEINEENWIFPRIEGVWWTDGQKNLKHMHGIEMLKYVRDFYDIALTGNHAIFIKGGYFSKGISEYDMLKNIQNRHINMGCKFRQNYVELRRPFIDNDLINFTFSIPLNKRAGMKIFKLFLLKMYSPYFTSIPYERYGLPISSPKPLIYANRIIKGTKRRLYNKGFSYFKAEGYTDYFSWIRKDPARALFSEILGNANAIYSNYISHDKVKRILKRHLDGYENQSEILCRYLTFEIWLQQLYESKYRPVK